MKKSLLVILLVLAGIASSYAMRNKKKPVKKVTFVSMHRSACFGRCPDYTIEIYNTGEVKYLGYMFVKDSGVYSKNIGVTKATALLKKFETYRVDTCQENYKVIIADVPGLFYTIKYNDEDKKIDNANFGPKYLEMLAKEIDAAIKVDASWKKLASEAKR